MVLTEVLAFAAFACGAIYCWLKYNYGYWKRKGIPYCEPVPFLGNTQDMFMLRNNFGMYLSKMYGEKRFQDEKVVGIYTLNKPALIIRDLEYLKSILIRDFKKFSNRYASSDPHGDALGSNNLFFVNNPKWKEIRTKLTPVFTSGKIKQMYPLMQEIGNDLETHLAGYDKKGHTITTEVKEICALYATDMIATIAFGLKVNSLGNPNTEFRVEGRKMFDFSLSRSFDFFVAFFLPRLTTLFRVKLFSKSYTKLLRENIGYVMSERERNGNIRNDLIDILVTLKKEAALELDRHHFAKNNDFLVAQAALFTAAGFETSSSTMSFALYELAKHPELQQRLRNEIHAALVEGNGEVSYEKIQSMEFIGLVLDEVLRLYPVLPFLDRQCTIEDGAEALSLKPDYDFEIPDGMAVFVPVFGIQRDAKYWPNPNKFDPERFSAENRKYHTPMTYLPFGTGPRHCMGSRIGLLQSKIGLMRILKNHHVATCDRTVGEIQFDPKALTLQCDGGIYLDVVYDGLYDKHRRT